jgi:hypothetical protein
VWCCEVECGWIEGGGEDGDDIKLGSGGERPFGLSVWWMRRGRR